MLPQHSAIARRELAAGIHRAQEDRVAIGHAEGVVVRSSDGECGRDLAHNTHISGKIIAKREGADYSNQVLWKEGRDARGQSMGVTDVRSYSPDTPAGGGPTGGGTTTGFQLSDPARHQQMGRPRESGCVQQQKRETWVCGGVAGDGLEIHLQAECAVHGDAAVWLDVDNDVVAVPVGIDRAECI